MLQLSYLSLPSYLAAYRNIFSEVRVVYPEECLVVNVHEDGSFSYGEKCHDIWDMPERCINCISYDAVKQGIEKEKEVIYGGSLYHIRSIPLLVTDEKGDALSFAIELIKITPVTDYDRPSNAANPCPDAADPSLTCHCSACPDTQLSGNFSDRTHLTEADSCGTDSHSDCTYDASNLNTDTSGAGSLNASTPETSSFGIDTSAAGSLNEGTPGVRVSAIDERSRVKKPSPTAVEVNLEDIVDNLEYHALHDPLTGLYNQEGFYRAVRTRLEETPDTAYYLLIANVIGFKFINFLYGIETGNHILISAAAMSRNFTTDNVIFARLYADRFAFLIRKDYYVEDDLLTYAKGIEALIDGNTYRLRIQLGLYEITNPNLPVSVMCGRASLALNFIGSNEARPIAYFRDSMMSETIRTQQIANHFPSSLDQGEFQMFLQPLVRPNGHLIGAEALCRWIRGSGEILSPKEFIPVLEGNGMIYKLDRYMWELAIRKLSEWQNTPLKDLFISINISPQDIRYMDILEELQKLTARYQVPASMLKLEFTENSLMEELDSYVSLITRLHENGFMIGIDDFGSGYSSLGMLKDINADVLKIDMSFLEHTYHPDRARIIFRSVVNMSQLLHMPVISEGVETQEQVDYVTSLGLTALQGFYFSRPLPVNEFESKYMERHKKRSAVI